MQKYNNRHLNTSRIQKANFATLDKLEFHTSEFLVNDNSSIVIQDKPHTLSESIDADKYDQPLFITSSGRPIRGYKAYINTDRFNLTIQSFQGTSTVRVSMNPNKLYHDYKPTPNEPEMIRQILSIKDDIDREGVLIPFFDCNVSRVDLMKQRTFTKPLSLHHPIFASMSAKRQFKRTFNETFMIGNRSHQTIFYDKSIESKIPNQSNLIRCEVRTLNGKTTQRNFGMRTVKDVMSYDLPTLTNLYNTHLRDRVFNTSYENIGNMMQGIELIKHLASQTSRPLEMFVDIKGVEGIITTFGNIDTFIDAMVHENIISRDGGNKQRRKLNQLSMFNTLDIDGVYMNELIDNVYAFAS